MKRSEILNNTSIDKSLYDTDELKIGDKVKFNFEADDIPEHCMETHPFKGTRRIRYINPHTRFYVIGNLCYGYHHNWVIKVN
jgi:hypothetical protein